MFTETCLELGEDAAEKQQSFVFLLTHSMFFKTSETHELPSHLQNIIFDFSKMVARGRKQKASLL
jgi:hypothetical protein